jgi:hypothetical protein
MLARMTRRISLAVALLTLVLPAVAQAAPDVTVRSVADPVPTGRAGAYGFRLKATVVNDGDAPVAASQLRFALSADEKLSADDPRVPLVKVEALGPDARDVVEASWKVPDRVEPGIYRVLACTDADDCAVAKETVAVTDPARETSKPPAATANARPPHPEYQPEDVKGAKIDAPQGCPASLHGQGDARCVWVTTPPTVRTVLHDGRDVDELWDCPAGYPYPFEVAIGFDPMWRDMGHDARAWVTAVSATRWSTSWDWFGTYAMSYGGSPSRGERGYVAFLFRSLVKDGSWTGQAAYLCANQRARSMWP